MSLEARVAMLLGSRVESATPLAGGDLSAVQEIQLADGRTAVVKGGPAPAVEAAMLEAIAARGVAAPAVLGFDEEILVIEKLPTGGGIHEASQDLGRALRRLHGGGDQESQAAQAYGWNRDYAFGDVLVENAWCDDWAEFWAERRLLNQLEFLPVALARRTEALAGRLPGLLPARPHRALLHGDLWGGNILCFDRRVSGLIDPACYFGHREVDLAMLSLFGGAGPEVISAYGRLEAGFESRRPIYQLWPAIVHVRLFGAAYHSMLDRLLAAVGA